MRGPKPAGSRALERDASGRFTASIGVRVPPSFFLVRIRALSGRFRRWATLIRTSGPPLAPLEILNKVGQGHFRRRGEGGRAGGGAAGGLARGRWDGVVGGGRACGGADAPRVGVGPAGGRSRPVGEQCVEAGAQPAPHWEVGWPAWDALRCAAVLPENMGRRRAVMGTQQLGRSPNVWRKAPRHCTDIARPKALQCCTDRRRASDRRRKMCCTAQRRHDLRSSVGVETTTVRPAGKARVSVFPPAPQRANGQRGPPSARPSRSCCAPTSTRGSGRI